MKVFTGENENVWKYVFDFDGAPAEAVLYRYPTFEERTVLCISTQSGCPVGCTFCGTGNRFIRNLSEREITDQVTDVLHDQGLLGNMFNCKKFQIMFMSMGEPFLNYNEVKGAIRSLHCVFPKADLLVSTMMPNQQKHLKDFIDLSVEIDKIGLQFSIHESNDRTRDTLIPYKNKLSLIEMRDYGVEWYARTGRQVYCNYCINENETVWYDKGNARLVDFQTLRHLLSPNAFAMTFSVTCASDETMKDAGFRNLEKIREFENLFIEAGYNTRVFDPAGQDDIGGGCGQLFYVQQKLKEYDKN